MITNPIGLYVHIPYCVRKCNYCDFCSLPSGDGTVPYGYIDRLISEAHTYKGETKIPVNTLYFGGGTPSLMPPSMLDKLLSSFGDIFDFSLDLELTIEANPGTLTKEKLAGYKSLGVNRISIGLQSIHENELKSLGRIHSYSDFLESYNAARRAGFDNLNVDLMYGIPHQSIDSFRSTLTAVANLSPEHISAYGLIVEEGTPFFKQRAALPLPDEDCECEMYALACGILSERGYGHYEISNYAKAGYESRHNLKYWRTEEYIGLGAAAHSYLGGTRYGNRGDVGEYISSLKTQYVGKELIDSNTERYEYAMMRLRLSEGFSLDEYRERFGVHFLEGKEETVNSLLRAELISINNGRISLSERGFYLSNSILVQIL